jgi:hypothetical protein
LPQFGHAFPGRKQVGGGIPHGGVIAFEKFVAMKSEFGVRMAQLLFGGRQLPLKIDERALKVKNDRMVTAARLG